MRLPPALIAHRGEMVTLPENTLPAILHALDAGARFVEFDVQLSSDLVPVLFHDQSLERTTGLPGEVGDKTAVELRQVIADFHLPSNHRDAAIPTLQEAVHALNGNKAVTVFVELKRHSVERFGIQTTVDGVMDVMRASGFPWVFISFNHEVLDYARRVYQVPLGLALRAYSDDCQAIARELNPEYVFCNKRKIDSEVTRLWPGSWRWVIYDVMDAQEIPRWQEAGATMIETGAISNLVRASIYADVG